MNKMIFITTVLCLLLTQLSAQQRQVPSAADRSAKFTEWMETNLQLTPEQVPTVQDINLKYASKNDSIRLNAQGKREKMKAVKSNEEAKDAELKQVLTVDQYKQYQSKKNEMKNKMKEKARQDRQSG